MSYLTHRARYLDADKVTLPTRPPLFVEEGHCQWCNKELTGKATRYCRGSEDYVYGDGYGNNLYSDCCTSFLNWWCSRPAYVRATLIKDNFTCQKCGLHPMREDKPWLPDISQLECDHIIPVSKGGETVMENLQTLCATCNRKKGATVPAGYRPKKRERKPDAPLLPEIGWLPLVRPGMAPLCGWPWLEENWGRGWPEQSMEIFHDGEVILTLPANPDGRGQVREAMKMAGKED
jgi:5-methylcytosine-specific restriction endonuclease McrA